MDARRFLGALGVTLVLSCGAALGVLRAARSRPASPAAPASAPAAAAALPAPLADAAPPEDRAPEILGRILDADGNAVAGATVRLLSAGGPVHVDREATTDPRGAFSFPRLKTREAKVEADHGADGVATSAVLRLGEQESLALTLVLSVANAVRGTVVDANGHAIAGAAVAVEGIPWSVRAVSDDAGAFRMTTVPEPATALVATARGYRAGHASLEGRSDQTELGVQLVLPAASPVAGEVRGDDGGPVVARVVACEGQSTEARTQSAADGTFELPPSAIGCTAIAENGELAASDEASVVEGRRLVLRLKSGGAIEGVVVDDRGAPLSPFTIGIESFVPARGPGFGRGSSRNVDDPGGAFRLEKLAPGTYVLTAQAAGKPLTRSSGVEVHAGAVTRGVRIVVGPGGALTGYVYDDARAPLADVDLRLDATSEVVPTTTTARTDATGRYRLGDLPSGPFTVLVAKNGYRVRLASGLRVDPGQTLRRDFTLAMIDGGGKMDFGGIGAGIGRGQEGFVFQKIFPDDPAAKAGLRAGDRIVSIDGEPAEGMSLADALQRLRGEPGTVVGVTAQHADGDTVNLTIVRGAIVQ